MRPVDKFPSLFKALRIAELADAMAAWAGALPGRWGLTRVRRPAPGVGDA